MSTPILLDAVQCVGNEISIADCHHRPWADHNCDHSEDVSVSCGTSPVQYGNLTVIMSIVFKINVKKLSSSSDT